MLLLPSSFNVRPSVPEAQFIPAESVSRVAGGSLLRLGRVVVVVQHGSEVLVLENAP